MSTDKAPDPDEVQDWYFTFGGGHRLRASGSDDSIPAAGEGLSLEGMYYVIPGTFASARSEMMRLFGARWSQQYTAEEFAGQAEQYGMKRLHWPPRDLGSFRHVLVILGGECELREGQQDTHCVMYVLADEVGRDRIQPYAARVRAEGHVPHYATVRPMSEYFPPDERAVKE